MFQWKLLAHMAKDHDLSLKPAHLSYKCTVCTASFTLYRAFEQHVYNFHSNLAKRQSFGSSSTTTTGVKQERTSNGHDQSSEGGKSDPITIDLSDDDDEDVKDEGRKEAAESDSSLVKTESLVSVKRENLEGSRAEEGTSGLSEPVPMETDDSVAEKVPVTPPDVGSDGVVQTALSNSLHSEVPHVVDPIPKAVSTEQAVSTQKEDEREATSVSADLSEVAETLRSLSEVASLQESLPLKRPLESVDDGEGESGGKKMRESEGAVTDAS